TLASTATSALVQLSSTPLTVTSGKFLSLPTGAVTLTGPLLSATSSALTIPDALIDSGNLVANPGSLVVSTSTDPLIAITNGVHAIATTAGKAMITLAGVTTTTDPDEGLTVGTNQPLQHGGAVIETTGATVTTEQA